MNELRAVFMKELVHQSLNEIINDEERQKRIQFLINVLKDTLWYDESGLIDLRIRMTEPTRNFGTRTLVSGVIVPDEEGRQLLFNFDEPIGDGLTYMVVNVEFITDIIVDKKGRIEWGNIILGESNV